MRVRGVVCLSVWYCGFIGSMRLNRGKMISHVLWPYECVFYMLYRIGGKKD